MNKVIAEFFRRNINVLLPVLAMFALISCSRNVEVRNHLECQDLKLYEEYSTFDSLLLGRSLTDVNGRIVGPSYSFNKGLLDLFLVVENDLPNGISVRMDERQVSEVGEYVNGKRNGVWLRLHPNGSLRDCGLFAEDELLQIYFSQDSSNNMLDFGDFECGNGRFISYYPDGKIKEQGSYVDGFRSGSWTFYGLDGTVLTTVDFVKGCDTSALIGKDVVHFF